MVAISSKSMQSRDKIEGEQASQYARSLIEASLDQLVTISPEGKVTDVNEATVSVTGRPRDELIGTDFSDYFTEPDKAREGQRVFAKGFVTDYPLTIRHKDGRLTDVLYNASVYKDVSGKVLGVFAAARDITAQKRAEALVAEQRGREHSPRHWWSASAARSLQDWRLSAAFLIFQPRAADTWIVASCLWRIAHNL